MKEERIVLIGLIFLLKVFAEIEAYENPLNAFNLKALLKESMKDGDATCRTSNDCPADFYCKFNDCVAKKPDDSLCLTHGDEECQCGKCEHSLHRFVKRCHSKTCENKGLTPFNKCEDDLDCPLGYFCNQLDHNLCTSKLKAGRSCSSDNMCICNRCITKSVQTRPSMPDIVYNICDAC